MVLAVYDISGLDKNKGYRCLWCLVISSAVISLVNSRKERNETLNIYETERQRNNALKYWRREYKFSDTVFFTFEIPIDFYLDKAEKHI